MADCGVVPVAAMIVPMLSGWRVYIGTGRSKNPRRSENGVPVSRCSFTQPEYHLPLSQVETTCIWDLCADDAKQCICRRFCAVVRFSFGRLRISCMHVEGYISFISRHWHEFSVTAYVATAAQLGVAPRVNLSMQTMNGALAGLSQHTLFQFLPLFLLLLVSAQPS